jgi:hypothetical protein
MLHLRSTSDVGRERAEARLAAMPAWCFAAARCLAVSTTVAGIFLGAGGCQLGALVGGMAASAERTGTSDIDAEYSGLSGKTFAVVVAADRSIQADYPAIVPILTQDITKRLVDHAGASGVVPAEDILRFQAQRPGWVAMSPGDLAKELEVERLVFIDLHDYTLTEPKNPYLWAGSATGVVNVLEADDAMTSEFVARFPVRVKFPDKEGLSPVQIPRELVATELARRFINRCSWLFYDHEEPNAITY